jgi:hypothetical protein
VQNTAFSKSATLLPGMLLLGGRIDVDATLNA